VALTVIVTDGEQRSALATVRSLGRADYSVHVCASRSNSIAGRSRYCASQTTVADPLRNPEEFASDLVRLVREKKADVLLPVTEASLLAVLPRRERFSCVIPFPAADAFERICDKRGVLERAALRGVAVPTQIEIAKPSERKRLDQAPNFPLVLKPSRSVSGPEGGRARAGVAYASDGSELYAALDSFPPTAYPILVQQRITGIGFGISVLLWDGELRAAFAHRRIREKPPSGGVSVLRESIPLDTGLLSTCVDLLRDFNWQGVAMVEFKLDDRSGAPYLMEINGRLWGSLQLAIDAGVDFPNLLVQSALGMSPAPATAYRTGVKTRWEWGDVDQLLSTLLHPKNAVSGSTPALKRPRLSAFADFFRAFSPENFPEVFRKDDPVPFFQETVNWFRGR
jgi:predicted ATP-grasp superfamily ATP-dependent carboligase